MLKVEPLKSSVPAKTKALPCVVMSHQQDEFQQGWFGPRTDGERTRQLRSDAARLADQQQGLI
ncbi:hypothetical protein MITS9509_01009 [Synechococcus sp. MIT S9509]|nr:hypothetical protein MITS9509_01009 [Synechococcus sp. MIT S9509]